MFRKAHQDPRGLAGVPLALLVSLACMAAPTEVRAAETVTADSATPEASKPRTVLEEGGSVLGKEVRSAADEKLGRIIDVIVDRTGTPRAALIDFGGFMGVGSRKIAVGWELLSFAGAAGEERITALITRDRLSRAPEFREGKPIIVLTARDVNPTRVTIRMPEQ